MSETWVLVYATYDTVQRNPGLFDHGTGLQEAVEDHGGLCHVWTPPVLQGKN